MASFAKASIIGLFVQAILYGLYTASFAYSLRWLLFTDEGWTLKLRKKSIVVASIICMSQTSDIVISAVMAIAAITGKAAVFNKLGIVNVCTCTCSVFLKTV
jgi:hypothetical protein